MLRAAGSAWGQANETWCSLRVLVNCLYRRTGYLLKCSIALLDDVCGVLDGWSTSTAYLVPGSIGADLVVVDNY